MQHITDVMTLDGVIQMGMDRDHPRWQVVTIVDGVVVCHSQTVNHAGDVARTFGAWGGPIPKVMAP